MMLTKLQPFCTWRTPSDIVFDALFNHGYHPIQPLNKYVFLQTSSQLRLQGVPRHDFESIPHELSRLTKMGYLPRNVDPHQKS